MSVMTRRGAAKRIRFGAFLVLALFAGVVLASHNGASLPNVPWDASLTLNGHAYASTYEMSGGIARLPGGLMWSTSRTCDVCSIRFDLTESTLTIVGDGKVGILPAGKTYEVTNFAGHVGISAFGPHDYALTLDGVAGKVRVAPEDYPYSR